ncbi:MAG: hypothetical protein HYY13_12760 [Nitrospirae bacterium]|nr:hypothetical protein [Nitrospirota bacterium]
MRHTPAPDRIATRDLTLDFSSLDTRPASLPASRSIEDRTYLDRVWEAWEGLMDWTRSPRGVTFFDLPIQPGLSERTRSTCSPLLGRDRQFVVIGIGGSTLGARGFVRALAPESERTVFFCESPDPHAVQDLLGKLDLARTSFVVTSKSGETVEVLALYTFFRERLEAQGLPTDVFLYITDPHLGVLRPLASREGAPSLPFPPRVGGRFSTLAAPGLVPALLAGLSPEGILAGAKRMRSILAPRGRPSTAFLRLVAKLLLLHEQYSHDAIVLFPYAYRLSDFTLWLAQLVAESVGKKNSRDGRVVHEGFTVVNALGPQDQHSQLQLFVEGPPGRIFLFLDIKETPGRYRISNAYLRRARPHARGTDLAELNRLESEATRATLAEAGRPILHVRLPSLTEGSLGALAFFMECLVATLGFALEINPFDQPGIARGKELLWNSLTP